MDDAVNVLTIISLAFSGIALVVSIYAAVLTRKHNRVSAMPIPASEILWTDEPPQLQINLINKGLGPALLMPTTRAYRDNIECECWPGEKMVALIASVGLKQATVTFLDGPAHMTPHGETVTAAIEPNGRLRFLAVGCAGMTALQLHDQLSRLSFEFEFRSIYGERVTEHLKLYEHPPGCALTFDTSIYVPAPVKSQS